MANEPLRLLVLTGGADAFRLSQGKFSFGGGSFKAEKLFSAAPRPSASLGLGPAPEWFVVESEPDENPWNIAHAAIADGSGLGLMPGASYVEPDLIQEWESPFASEAALSPLAAAPVCQFVPQQGPWPAGPKFAWFLEKEYSGLRNARNGLDHQGIRIAHLDTGYTEHVTRPANIIADLGFNFVENVRDAHDPGIGGLLHNPGHGTATLAILAGNTLKGLSQAHQNLNEPLGGAPNAQIVPVRIANSVVHFGSSSMARGLEWAIAPNGDPSKRCDVVSISMGGVPSRAWADAVNMAYEAGVCIVAAAGNNFFAGTVNSIVYPARFKRVIAVCGITADYSPYYRPGDLTEMQGNFGPATKMESAIAAYTPNMPWAHMGCPELIRENGQGTSSATPQVAAAAALWLAKHKPAYDQPWKRVAAVREALFSKANTDLKDRKKFYGSGSLRAAAALEFAPPAAPRRTEADSVFLPLLKVLTGIGIAPPQVDMLHVEACQLLQKSKVLSEVLTDPDHPNPDRSKIKPFLEALISEKQVSQTLRRFAEAQYLQEFGAVPSGVDETDFEDLVPPSEEIAPPSVRRIRGYAFDPSISTSLDTAGINEVTFRVRWEKLDLGPTGEYLEVVDHDGGTKKALHQPVDLEHAHILARDGLDPSEGNPQFHQQMVYAVAMTTIQHFERALGRPVMWRPKEVGDAKDDSGYVRQLKVLPHAIRQENAFYSPEQRALLFGYFPARSGDPGRQFPGGITFTCLSHDIIAHETTHAILDGIHRRFSQPTNPDMLAFHEAFADIVALFQHFTFPEVLRHQIAKTRGDLSTPNLLAELAQEFGAALGLRGALRSAIGQPANPALIHSVMEPHARGSILVATIFDAFIAIYNLRVADLLRIASDGSGILRPGHLPSDLVNRLATEAATAARQVLDICIRALDYCPPVDITFGDYLRALVTADHDLVPEDRIGYRLAFLEAFRRRGLYPSDVSTLSVESLRWTRPPAELKATPAMDELITRLRTHAEACSYMRSREEIFHATRKTRSRLNGIFMRILKEAPPKTVEMFGLEGETRSVEVHSLQIAQRTRLDGSVQAQATIELTKSKSVPLNESKPEFGSFDFFGGCTLVIDLFEKSLRYAVTKNITSENRLHRVRTFLNNSRVGMAFSGLAEPFALLHGCDPAWFRRTTPIAKQKGAGS